MEIRNRLLVMLLKGKQSLIRIMLKHILFSCSQAGHLKCMTIQKLRAQRHTLTLKIAISWLLKGTTMNWQNWKTIKSSKSTNLTITIIILIWSTRLRKTKRNRSIQTIKILLWIRSRIDLKSKENLTIEKSCTTNLILVLKKQTLWSKLKMIGEIIKKLT
jgi:hypothetical protein